jgi:hypothetical protein
MKRSFVPTISDGYFFCADFPAAFSLASSEWQNWLETHAKFRYEGTGNSFSAFKDNRGYWVAQKRVGGNLRQKRLGNSQALAKMTEFALAEIAQNLCSQDYNRQKRDNDPDCLNHRIAQLETEIGHWKDEIYKLRQENDRLQKELDRAYNETASQTGFKLTKATDILKQALKLKANAGGAIKAEIQKALEILSENQAGETSL